MFLFFVFLLCRFSASVGVAGLKRGPLSLVRTTEELLGRKSSGSGVENRAQRPWGSVALTTQHPLSAKVATTSPTSGGRSVGIVRSRTKATEFSFSWSVAWLLEFWVVLWLVVLLGMN
jgi:hypothetical protein